METKTANYESTIILTTKLDEEATASMVEKFKSLIAEHGTVANVDEWGKKRLAYTINHENEGYYVYYTYQSGPDFIKEFDRVCNITEGVIRWLTVKCDED